MQHGAAPHNRLLVLHEHADGDDLHPVGHRRHDHAVELGGHPVHPQHAGDGEAVDVGVYHAHAQALGGHGGGEVRSHRGLADPSLAGGDGVDPGEVARLSEGNHRFGGPSAQAAPQLGLLLIVHDAQAHLHLGDTLDGADLASGVGGDRVLQGAPGHGQEHLDTDHAVLGDVNGGDHSQVGDGAVQLGVDDPGQRLHDGVMSRLRHGPILGAPSSATTGGESHVRAGCSLTERCAAQGRCRARHRRCPGTRRSPHGSGAPRRGSR